MQLAWRANILLVIQALTVTMVTGFLSLDFKDCKEFFKDRFRPENFPKELPKIEICQRLDGTTHYATMYNLKHKMPLYSAYKLDRIDVEQPEDLRKWMIELGLSAVGGDMGDEKELSKEEKKLQAINKDYIEALEPVVRGQMAPKAHMSLQSRISTFTLTNAAPFFEKFQAVWKIVEQETKKLMDQKCLYKDNAGQPYFITGTVPGLSKIPEKFNIPTYAYSAAACDHENSADSFSFGVLGLNDEAEGDPKNIPVLVTDVVTLGKKIKDKWVESTPPTKPIKFFKDNGNAQDKSGVKELKEVLRKRGVNVVDVDV